MIADTLMTRSDSTLLCSLLATIDAKIVDTVVNRTRGQ